MAVFDFFTGKKRSHADMQQYASPTAIGGVGQHCSYQASCSLHTQLPFNEFMTRLMAQELPMVDSCSRIRIYEILRDYSGPEITCVEQLPNEIRDLMELY